ncbi:hemerythrin domain-containing protein [Actinoplanes sp. CA-054009]
MMIDPLAPADKPETAQMVVIHRALRRELALLPGLIAAVRPGDTTRATLLGRHLALVLHMLHDHHEAEDELLWPILEHRAPMSDDLVATMIEQHRVVESAVASITRELPKWTARAGDPAPLAETLGRLREALEEHLDAEERSVLPLIHEHLTVAEWKAPQAYAMAHGPKALTDKLLQAGLVLEEANPREEAWFLAEMPPPARLLWRLMGRRLYARRVAAVRLK